MESFFEFRVNINTDRSCDLNSLDPRGVQYVHDPFFFSFFFLKNVLRINTYKIYVIFTLLSFVVHFNY